MKHTWLYFNNPFEAATIDSYLNAYRISAYHLAALDAAKGDPFINEMYIAYKVVHDAYVSAYNAWKLQGGEQLSKSSLLNQLFETLKAKISKWNVKIMDVYEPKTPGYVRLMPHGKTIYQNGSQTTRLTALQNLDDALATEGSNLQPVKVDVTAFNTDIKKANNNQKTAKSTTSVQSDAVEAQRIVMCTQQFANLGGLLQKNAANPTALEHLFDLEHIRRSPQDVFTRQLAPGQNLFIVKRGLQPDDILELTNTGETKVSFYEGANKKATKGGTVISLGPNSSKLVTGNNFGDIANLHFLFVVNEDNTMPGSIEVYFK